MRGFLCGLSLVLLACHHEDSGRPADDSSGPCDSPIDDDGDGYVSMACASGIDCDDDDPSVNPGAAEVCNDKDDDCDGIQPQAPTWYEDVDGDGSGSLESSEAACEAPDGFVADSSDCDDANADIHVGGEESCGDTIDQDCDGTDLYCGYLGEYDLADTAQRLVCPSDGERCGWDLATGDVTGDGTADLIVTLGVTIRGGAYILPGGPIDELTMDDAYIVTASTNNWGSGFSVSAPDADGDGVQDIAVGFPDQRGLYIAHGPISGDVDFALDADAAFRCHSDFWCGFAHDVADVNGDGHADAVVGAYRDNTGDSNPGFLYVEFGPLVGETDLEVDADVEIVGAGEYAGLGYAVDASHDLNGDGTGDIAVSAWLDSIGALYGGAVYIIDGPVEIASLADADGVLAGTVENGASGHPFVIGEIDGDGTPDVAASVGTNAPIPRATAVVLGPLAGRIDWSDADTIIEGSIPTGTLGGGMGISDVDDDGVEELLIGDLADSYTEFAGVAYLVVTPPTGTSNITDVAQATFHGSGTDFVGNPFTAGDLDGDGDVELVFGAMGFAPTGAVYVQAPGD